MLMTEMPGVSDTFLIQCRMAMGLSQEEFGDMLGRTKRTVQRWEERGATLIPQEVEALARALHPTRPDLAARVAEAADTTLERLGIAGAMGASLATTPDPVEAVVRSAADVLGVTSDAIRPAIVVAFERAAELGLDVRTVAQTLRSRERR